MCFVFTTDLQERFYCCSCFTDEDTEGEPWYVTCPESGSYGCREPGLTQVDVWARSLTCLCSSEEWNLKGQRREKKAEALAILFVGCSALHQALPFRMINSVLSCQWKPGEVQPDTHLLQKALPANPIWLNFLGWPLGLCCCWKGREREVLRIVFWSAGLETLSVWLTGWWKCSSVSCGLKSGLWDRKLGLSFVCPTGECRHTSQSDRNCLRRRGAGGDAGELWGADTGIATAEKEFEKQTSKNQNKGESVYISVKIMNFPLRCWFPKVWERARSWRDEHQWL